MQLPYHYMHQGLECTSSNIMSQSSAVVSWDCLVDSFASPPWAMCMLLDDIQWRWSCHHSQQGLDGDTPWYRLVQRTVTVKLVAGLTLFPYFCEWCWCSEIICNDDGNTNAIPSHPPRIEVHNLWCAVTKFSHSKPYIARQIPLPLLLKQRWCSLMTHDEDGAISSQPARIGRHDSVVYTVTKHRHSWDL